MVTGGSPGTDPGHSGGLGSAPGDLVRSLSRIVGERHVLVDPDLTASYEADWTRRWGAKAALVVLPASTEEVAAVVRRCASEGLPLVPQGGNTGLVGGGVPRGGEVVVSLRRLATIGEVDRAGGSIEVGAGARLAEVQDAARRAGWEFGVDLAARESACIGGMVATNAGGVRVLRYGPMRSNVLGLEAVLADGTTVTRMGGVVKDSAGYDTVGLLVGSEGTLAVVTRALLKLVPRMPHRVTALVGIAPGTGAEPERVAVEASLRVLSRLRASVEGLEVAEITFDDGMALVETHAGLPHPLAKRFPAYLLLECASPSDPTASLATALGGFEEVADSAVAGDSQGRASLWQYRDRHTEAVATLGVAHKLDVSLPLGALGRFVSEVRGVVGEVAPGATTVVWGHLGEGNVHVNVVGPEAGDTRVDEAVFRMVASLGGSISAEHGVGVAKARWLSLARSPADIELMAAVKQALDPGGVLNPGVLFEHRLSVGDPPAGTAPG